MTKAYSIEVEYELQLVLKAADVPGCVLQTGLDAQPLGWLTWIRSGQQVDEPRMDTVLLLE